MTDIGRGIAAMVLRDMSLIALLSFLIGAGLGAAAVYLGCWDEPE